MDINILLFLLGRILFGGYFVMSCLNHLTKLEAMTGYALSKGVKPAKPAVVISGLMIILGGAGLLLGLKIGWSVGLIASFLILVTFKMHAFWKVPDPNYQLIEKVNFMKNLALLGAVLMMLMITAWPASYGG